MCIGATRNNTPPLRSMLLPRECAECFASPRPLAVDYSGQKALPIKPGRAGTRFDPPDSYEGFRWFYTEEAAFRGLVPIFVSRKVVV